MRTEHLQRLLVLDKNTGEITHKHFYDIIDYLDEGDCLVLNETKVIPARLMGVKKDTGAAIEILLLKRKSKTAWECLVKPGKKCKVGAVIEFGDGLLIGTISDIVEEGNRIIEFEFDGIFEEILDKLGTMPLLPILHILLRIKTGIRPYTQRMRVRRRLLRQDCILRRNCLRE